MYHPGNQIAVVWNAFDTASVSMRVNQLTQTVLHYDGRTECSNCELHRYSAAEHYDASVIDNQSFTAVSCYHTVILAEMARTVNRLGKDSVPNIDPAAACDEFERWWRARLFSSSVVTPVTGGPGTQRFLVCLSTKTAEAHNNANRAALVTIRGQSPLSEIRCGAGHCSWRARRGMKIERGTAGKCHHMIEVLNAWPDADTTEEVTLDPVVDDAAGGT